MSCSIQILDFYNEFHEHFKIVLEENKTVDKRYGTEMATLFSFT